MTAAVDGEWETVIPPWYSYGFTYQDMRPETYEPAALLAGDRYTGTYTELYGGSR